MVGSVSVYTLPTSIRPMVEQGRILPGSSMDLRKSLAQEEAAPLWPLAWILTHKQGVIDANVPISVFQISAWLVGGGCSGHVASNSSN
jgi:hypothetical protein